MAKKKLIACLFFSFFFAFLPFFSKAEIVVWPTIINAETEPRGLLEYAITVQNSGRTMASLYPVVRNIFPDGEESDKINSLAGWIEITRGRIELLPGEEKEIPFSVRVPSNATKGKYYAGLCFARGSTRPEAEANALKFNQPETLLYVEVKEHIIERAQINKFSSQKNLFLSFPIRFAAEVENIGNREIVARGAIRLYNRRGEELTSIELNETSISPQAVNAFRPVWQIDHGFGRYKANLLVEYGSLNNHILQDTIYFWIFPLPWLLLGLVALLGLVVGSFVIIFKKLRNYYPEKPSLKKVKHIRPKK